MRAVSVVGGCDCAKDGAASPMPRARMALESKSDFILLPPLEVECGGTGCKFSAADARRRFSAAHIRRSTIFLSMKCRLEPRTTTAPLGRRCQGNATWAEPLLGEGVRPQALREIDRSE